MDITFTNWLRATVVDATVDATSDHNGSKVFLEAVMGQPETSTSLGWAPEAFSGIRFDAEIDFHKATLSYEGRVEQALEYPLERPMVTLRLLPDKWMRVRRMVTSPETAMVYVNQNGDLIIVYATAVLYHIVRGMFHVS